MWEFLAFLRLQQLHGLWQSVAKIGIIKAFFIITRIGKRNETTMNKNKGAIKAKARKTSLRSACRNFTLSGVPPAVRITSDVIKSTQVKMGRKNGFRPKLYYLANHALNFSFSSSPWSAQKYGSTLKAVFKLSGAV
jgi:hypothetical protein